MIGELHRSDGSSYQSIPGKSRTMSFDELQHTPEHLELPEFGPAYPEDLRGLMEEHFDGLTKVSVAKKMARNKYEPIATIICQAPTHATKKTRPVSDPDTIADYAMLCIQSEIDRNDDPGNYKVTIIGPPGKGRFEYSKHVNLTDGDGIARSISMQNEGDIVEQQSAYIGELHSQIVSMVELVSGSYKVLVQEHREQTKIISESVRRIGEVEAQRLRHDLEMKMHNDDIETKKAEQEASMMRWKELLNLVKDTGAPEAILKAVMKKVNTPSKKEQAAKEKAKEKEAEESKEKPDKEEKKGSPWTNPEGEEKTGKRRKKKRKKKKKGEEKGEEKSSEPEEEKGDEPVVAEPEGERSDEEMEAEYYQEALEKIEKYPLVMAAEALKMSIDVNKQWPVIRDILSEEQYEALEEAFAGVDDEEVTGSIQALYDLKGAKNLAKLSDELDDQQEKFIEILLDAIER